MDNIEFLLRLSEKLSLYIDPRLKKCNLYKIKILQYILYIFSLMIELKLNSSYYSISIQSLSFFLITEVKEIQLIYKNRFCYGTNVYKDIYFYEKIKLLLGTEIVEYIKKRNIILIYDEKNRFFIFYFKNKKDYLKFKLLYDFS